MRTGIGSPFVLGTFQVTHSIQHFTHRLWAAIVTERKKEREEEDRKHQGEGTRAINAVVARV